MNSPSPPPRNQSIKTNDASLPSTSSSTEGQKENGVSLNQNKNRHSLVEPLKNHKQNEETNSLYVNSEPANDEDYANTPLAHRQTKVSQKIQQLLLTLQVSPIYTNMKKYRPISLINELYASFPSNSSFQ